jgi:hypothetical protein
MTNLKYKNAKKYYNNGFNLCLLKHGTKNGLVGTFKGDEEFHENLNQKVLKNLKENPKKYNYGVILGFNNIALDLDFKDDKDGKFNKAWTVEQWNILKSLMKEKYGIELSLEKGTIIQQSPSGGYHIFYKLKDEMKENIKKDGRTSIQDKGLNGGWLDTRHGNGYVIGAGCSVIY